MLCWLDRDFLNTLLDTYMKHEVPEFPFLSISNHLYDRCEMKKLTICDLLVHFSVLVAQCDL